MDTPQADTKTMPAFLSHEASLQRISASAVPVPPPGLIGWVDPSIAHPPGYQTLEMQLQAAVSRAATKPHNLTREQVSLLPLTTLYNVLRVLRDILPPRRSYLTNRVILFVLEKLCAYFDKKGQLEQRDKYSEGSKALRERVAIQEYWWEHNKMIRDNLRESGLKGEGLREAFWREVDGDRDNRIEMSRMLRRLGNPGVGP